MTTAAALTAAILTLVPRMDRIEAHQDAVQLVGYGRARDLEPELLAAVAMRESTFRRLAVSSFRDKRRGGIGHSVGLLGIKTTEEPSDLFDMATNVSAGSKLLAAALKACNGDVPSALTAYARGPGKHAKNCRPSKYSTEVLAFYMRLVETTKPMKTITTTATTKG